MSKFRPMSKERVHEVATMLAIASRLKPTEAERASIARLVETIPRKERERYQTEVRLVRRALKVADVLSGGV